MFLPSFLKRKQDLLRPINRFNLLVSDRISLDRRLPDARPKACLAADGDNADLRLSVAVIVVAHNEAYSTLMRTLHSVARRSEPRRLLRRVIVVDDASDRLYMTDGRVQQGMDALAADSETNGSRTDFLLLRQEKRTGLVGARLLGAAAAGDCDVLLFLDAHVECTKGWLAPLIRVLQSDAHVLVSPVIDVIHDETFAFARSFDQHVGGFNWNLQFRWFASTSAPPASPAEPFATPVMAGGLFAVHRRFFQDMGAYEERMKIWGAENIELSLRTWMCGGRLLTHPCSHVGHVFRRSSPYTFNDGLSNGTSSSGGDAVSRVLYANLARVVDVWMDDHAYFFRLLNPLLAAAVASAAADDDDEDSVSERRRLRQRLHCRSFQWFLDSVWGDANFFPHSTRSSSSSDRPTKTLVQIQSAATGLCVEQQSAAGKAPRLLTLERCSIEGNFAPQLFVYDSRHHVLQSDEALCTDVLSSARRRHLFMNACHPLLFSPGGRGGDKSDGGSSSRSAMRQRFEYSSSRRRIMHHGSSTDGDSRPHCVTLEANSRKLLTTTACDDDPVNAAKDGHGDRRQLQELLLLPVHWQPIDQRQNDGSS